MIRSTPSLLASILALSTISFGSAAWPQDTTSSVSVGQGAKHSKPSSPLVWKSNFFHVTFSGNAVSKKYLGKTLTGEALYTNQPDKSGNVAFSCLNGSLSANVGLEPVDFEMMFSEFPRSRRGRIRLLSLTIDGETVPSGRWTYATDLNTYMPQKKAIFRKIYNAAIRGANVTVSKDFNDPIKLLLPKPNVPFANFGAGCEIGNKSE